MALITEIQCKECDFKAEGFTPAIYLIDLSEDALVLTRQRLATS